LSKRSITGEGDSGDSPRRRRILVITPKPLSETTKNGERAKKEEKKGSIRKNIAKERLGETPRRRKRYKEGRSQ